MPRWIKSVSEDGKDMWSYLDVGMTGPLVIIKQLDFYKVYHPSHRKGLVTTAVPLDEAKARALRYWKKMTDLAEAKAYAKKMKSLVQWYDGKDMSLLGTFSVDLGFKIMPTVGPYTGLWTLYLFNPAGGRLSQGKTMLELVEIAEAYAHEARPLKWLVKKLSTP